MDFSPETIDFYLRQAYGGMHRALERLDDTTVNIRPPGWGTNSVAGLIVHCCELGPSWFEMPGLGRESVRDRDQEFQTQATVAELEERIATSLERTSALLSEFLNGPTAQDHPFRAFMPGGDQSDAALILHVVEELYQHLGHIEVTTDAASMSEPGTT